VEWRNAIHACAQAHAEHALLGGEYGTSFLQAPGADNNHADRTDAADGASAEPGTSGVRQFDPPTEIAGLVTAVDAWNAANPNVQVKLETLGGADTQAQLAREIPAGGGPDIQQMAFVWTRDLARSNLLLDLSDLVAANAPGAGVEDCLATELATLDGKLFGLPWSADTFTLAHRPDLLEAADVALPDTWGELTATA
jgi:multiple sugar transport system substrate-binding protein